MQLVLWLLGAWCAGWAAAARGDCYNPAVLEFGATLVFGFELLVSVNETGLDTGVTVDMEEERDTDTFRQKAYDWLYAEYGLELDAGVRGFQVAANAPVFVLAQAAHPDLFYPVRAWDDALGKSPYPVQHRLVSSDVELDHAVYLALPQAAEARWTNENPASATYQQEYVMTQGEHVVSYGSYRVVVDGEPVTDEDTDLYFHTRAGELHHLSAQGTIIEEEMESAWWGEGKLMGFQTMRAVEGAPDLRELRSRNVMTYNEQPPPGTECRDVSNGAAAAAGFAPPGMDTATGAWWAALAAAAGGGALAALTAGRCARCVRRRLQGYKPVAGARA